MADSTGSARQEAERLVATVLAMAAQSGLGGAGRGDGSGTTGLGALADTVAGVVGQLTGGIGGHRGDPGKGWATGSAECCVCPVCRVIAGLRDPSPHAAERLATGAGDFATGVASLMRAFSAMSGDRRRPARPARPAPPPPDPDTAWSAATRGPGHHDTAPRSAPDETASPWAAATRAPAPPPAAPEAGSSGEAGPITEPGPTGTAGPITEPGPTGKAGPTGVTDVGPTGEAGPATAVGSEAGAGAKARPDAGMWARPRAHAGKNDVWAAATADPGDPVVAVPPAVDHDDRDDGRNR
jgi:hypothetical protein